MKLEIVVLECKLCGKRARHTCRPFEQYNRQLRQWVKKETNFTRSERLLELYLLEKHNVTVSFIFNLSRDFEIDPNDYYPWFDINKDRLL